MSNATIVDFIVFRDHQKNESHHGDNNSAPDDLGTAIQVLIQQLRESNPLS